MKNIGKGDWKITKLPEKVEKQSALEKIKYVYVFSFFLKKEKNAFCSGTVEIQKDKGFRNIRTSQKRIAK